MLFIEINKIDLLYIIRFILARLRHSNVNDYSNFFFIKAPTSP